VSRYISYSPFESKHFESALDPIIGGVDWKPAHSGNGKGCSVRDRCFGDECFQHGILLCWSEGGCAKSLDVQGQGGTHVGECFLEGVALADDRSPGPAQRVSDIAIRMLFDDDFEGRCHEGRMARAGSQGKCAKYGRPTAARLDKKACNNP
jgi:hypothetical protein